MTTTIYKFEQGRLLVNESRAAQSQYNLSGVAVRIGGVRQIEQVLSVTTDYERYGLVTPLAEVRTSGDEIFVVMRRGDLGGFIGAGISGTMLSGIAISGLVSYGLMSGITSGLAPFAELLSGHMAISGVVTVTANVIGY